MLFYIGRTIFCKFVLENPAGSNRLEISACPNKLCRFHDAHK